MPGLTAQKKLFFISLILLFFAALLEGSSALLIRKTRLGKSLQWPPQSLPSLMRSKIHDLTYFLDDKSMYVHHPDLGWTNNPALNGVNPQGLRMAGTAPLAPPKNKTRVAAFGDSFTFGYKVKAEEAWPNLMNEKREELEVINFGVPAYGVDQAFLRYQLEGRNYKPAVVLIGFLPADEHRHVSRFRGFLRNPKNLPLSKPRYVLESGRLALIPNPLSRRDDYVTLYTDPEKLLDSLGRLDANYEERKKTPLWMWSPTLQLISLHLKGPADSMEEKLTPGTDRYNVTKAILLEFGRSVQEDGAKPVFVFFGEEEDHDNFVDGKPSRLAPLIQDVKKAGFPVIDTRLAFTKEMKTPDLYAFDHYTPLGNELAEEYIYRSLVERGVVR